MDVKEVLLPGWACDTSSPAIAVTGSASLPGAVAVSTSSCMAAMIRTKPDRFCGSPMKRPRRWLRFWVRRGSPSDLPS